MTDPAQMPKYNLFLECDPNFDLPTCGTIVDFDFAQFFNDNPRITAVFDSLALNFLDATVYNNWGNDEQTVKTCLKVLHVFSQTLHQFLRDADVEISTVVVLNAVKAKFSESVLQNLESPKKYSAQTVVWQILEDEMSSALSSVDRAVAENLWATGSVGDLGFTDFELSVYGSANLFDQSEHPVQGILLTAGGIAAVVVYPPSLYLLAAGGAGNAAISYESASIDAEVAKITGNRGDAYQAHVDQSKAVTSGVLSVTPVASKYASGFIPKAPTTSLSTAVIKPSVAAPTQTAQPALSAQPQVVLAVLADGTEVLSAKPASVPFPNAAKPFFTHPVPEVGNAIPVAAVVVQPQPATATASPAAPKMTMPTPTVKTPSVESSVPVATKVMTPTDLAVEGLLTPEVPLQPTGMVLAGARVPAAPASAPAANPTLSTTPTSVPLRPMALQNPWSGFWLTPNPDVDVLPTDIDQFPWDGYRGGWLPELGAAASAFAPTHNTRISQSSDDELVMMATMPPSLDISRTDPNAWSSLDPLGFPDSWDASGYYWYYRDNFLIATAQMASGINAEDRTQILSAAQDIEKTFSPAFGASLALTVTNGRLPQLGYSYTVERLRLAWDQMRAGVEVNPIYAFTVIYDLAGLNLLVGPQNADAFIDLVYLALREWGTTPHYTAQYGRAPGRTVLLNRSLAQTVRALQTGESPTQSMEVFLHNLPVLFAYILTQFRSQIQEIDRQLAMVPRPQNSHALLTQRAYYQRLVDSYRVNNGNLEALRDGEWVSMREFTNSLSYSAVSVNMQQLAATDALAVNDFIAQEAWRVRNEGVRQAELAATGTATSLSAEGRIVTPEEIYAALKLKIGDEAFLDILLFRLAYRQVVMAKPTLGEDERVRRATEIVQQIKPHLLSDVRGDLPLAEASDATKLIVTQIEQTFWEPMDEYTLALYDMAGGIRNLHDTVSDLVGIDQASTMAEHISSIEAILTRTAPHAWLTAVEVAQLQSFGLQELLIAYRHWTQSMGDAALSNREKSFLAAVVQPKIEAAQNFIDEAAYDFRDRTNVLPSLYPQRILDHHLAYYREQHQTTQPNRVRIYTLDYAHLRDNRVAEEPVNPTIWPESTRDEPRVAALETKLDIHLINEKVKTSSAETFGTPAAPTSMLGGDEGSLSNAIALPGEQELQPELLGEWVRDNLSDINGEAFPYTHKTPNPGMIMDSESRRPIVRLPLWNLELTDGTHLTVSAKANPSELPTKVYVVDGPQTQKGQLIDLTPEQISAGQRAHGGLEVRIVYTDVDLTDLVNMDPNSAEYAAAYWNKVEEIATAVEEARDYDNDVKNMPKPTEGVYPMAKKAAAAK